LVSREPVALGRWRLLGAAHERMVKAAGPARVDTLLQTLLRHALTRWGEISQNQSHV
jgi:hypothetical protein